MEKFLAVNKSNFGLGLKSIDILIISQIEEYERNKCQCFLTNEQFSEMFGESVSTIKRTLDKLDDLGIIKRDTFYVDGFGRANRQRVLSVNKRSKWKVQNEPTINEMVGSKSDNGRFKSEEWKVHNDPIKDNLKENKKDNLEERETAELREILDKFENRVSYNTLREEYGISSVNKDLGRKIKDIIHSREHKEAQNFYLPEYSDVDYDALFQNKLRSKL